MRCNWTDSSEDEDGNLIGRCDLKRGHPDRFHVEHRDGAVWASWSGGIPPDDDDTDRARAARSWPRALA